MRQGFVDERAMITITGKSLYLLCLRKKGPENAFLTLTVNYCKIVQKHKLSLKITRNWLFNDICYLVMGCFD